MLQGNPISEIVPTPLARASYRGQAVGQAVKRPTPETTSDARKRPKLESTNTHSFSGLFFERSRVLYSAPMRKANGNVQIGLPYNRELLQTRVVVVST